MTGPAEGKLDLNATVYLGFDGNDFMLENAAVYIHLKGYALARVTHLDVEHEALNHLIPPKRGKFLSIRGIQNGLEILLERSVTVEVEGKILSVKSVRVFSPLLNIVLGLNQKTRTWVGGKFGGIYIGFKKPEVKKLENIAKTYFNMAPI